MKNGMNRRDFLKATAAAGTILLSGDLLEGVSTADTRVNIPEAEKISITVITDNLADLTRPDYKIAQRKSFTSNILEAAMHAEHGLSYQIETIVNGQPHCCLFDFATDPRGVIKNMDLLGIDCKKVEALGLSHDHFDHESAMVEILKAKKGSFSKSIPLYIGKEFFIGTWGKRPNGKIAQLNDLKKEDIEALGFVRIVEIDSPTPIIPGAYLPGKIDQVTAYEGISPAFIAKKGNEFVQETFIGEQAVILNAKGKGIVVLSGCAHRGIVNAVRHAQKMTGIDKVHMVMGGFHLTGATSDRIQKTISDIKAINPEYIVPTHCTGFEAISAFAREMPNQFILNTAGTKYTIA